jgi:hypothetical protein
MHAKSALRSDAKLGLMRGVTHSHIPRQHLKILSQHLKNLRQHSNIPR